MRRIPFSLSPAAFVAAALILASAPSLGAAAPESAAANVRRIFHRDYAARTVPLLLEVIRFPTVAGNTAALTAQQAWLKRVAGEMGFVVREAGPVTEIELAGPAGAPVLGLLVHGDVQPVSEAEWTHPPFAGVEKDGMVWGRGAADDKGPLVQALLAMRALADSGLPRTHTLRLLVGSDEESTGLDLKTYLEDHTAPDLSLVLDCSFPVVVGEKAWNALSVTVESPFAVRGGSATAAAWEIVALEAGISDSIVPSRAAATLRWRAPSLDGLPAAIAVLAAKSADGLRLEVSRDARDARAVTVVAHGRAAHAGLNLEGGRNALVFLARSLEGRLAPSGAADLLDFARDAGVDVYGTGLGLTTSDPLWGRYAVNVATVRVAKDSTAAGGALVLTTNVRRTPPLTGPRLRTRLEALVADWNARHGAHLVPSGFYDDEPLVLDPNGELVRRLLAAYERATGVRAKPAISGGGTYAKRMPRSIAFGMWFPGQPYPGHDTDERIPVADLLRGTDVLIEALTDLATSPPVEPPARMAAAPDLPSAQPAVVPAPAAVQTVATSSSGTRDAAAEPATATDERPTSDEERQRLRADTHNFVFFRGSSEHSSALYGGVAFGRGGGAFAALVKNPRNGYHEAIGGLFTGMVLGRADLTLGLAYADASDGRYVQLYVTPSAHAGPWSFTGTVELYQPWQGSGVRQLYLDPVTALRTVGGTWEVGASYALGVSAGDAPVHRAGPAMQLAFAGGALRAEVLHDFSDEGNDLRVVFQRGF